VKRAGAKVPFTLKNVLVQDTQYHLPIAQAQTISVEIASQLVPQTNGAENIPITKEMRHGVAPVIERNVTANTPNLMLVHGYCSKQNPWNNGDFQNGAYFLEAEKSLSVTDFSDLVMKYADKLGMTHWGGIAHSQGGHVLANILNYYHSGLDASTGGRKVQAVGTPWMGCGLAGSIASLGAVFGIKCGSNFDLTTDGANLWLVGITPETKSQIFFYTTTYEQASWSGDWCNVAANLVLKWPNDGTTELSRGILQGANYMGNKEKWCHAGGMAYDPQYQDHQRNFEMNAADTQKPSGQFE